MGLLGFFPLPFPQAYAGATAILIDEFDAGGFQRPTNDHVVGYCHSSNGSQDVSRRHYLGIFCISLATLLLELAFTRVLAVASWYHFAFLIISMALLGFGTSGVVLTLWEWLRERASIDHSLAALSLLFGCVVFISYWLMQN